MNWQSSIGKARTRTSRGAEELEGEIEVLFIEKCFGRNSAAGYRALGTLSLQSKNVIHDSPREITILVLCNVFVPVTLGSRYESIRRARYPKSRCRAWLGKPAHRTAGGSS